MPSVPTWRTPSVSVEGHKNANWALEIHRPSWNDDRIPKCEGIAKSTGLRCKNPSVRGSCYCPRHSGTRGLEKKLLDGSSVRILRTRPQKRILDLVKDRSQLAEHRLIRKSYGNFYEHLKKIDQQILEELPKGAVQQFLLCSSPSAKLSHYKTFANRKIDPRAWYELLKHIKNKDL